MAISWGSWAAGQSGSKSRLGVDRTITSTSTTTTVSLTVYIEFSGYYATGTSTLTFSGGHTGSTSVSLSFSGSGTRNLGTYTNSFSRAYGSNTSRSTSVSLTNFAGGAPSLSTSYTIPRRAYSAPAAPSSVTVSRVDDSSADVSWAVPSSTSAPVASVEIIRRVNDGGWATSGATVNKASGTLRVTGQDRGNRYQWAVRGKNQDATGPYGYSPWLYQRPLDVSNVAAARSGNNIVLSWVDQNAVQYGGFRIFDNGVEVATVEAGTTTWTHIAPSTAVTHRYDVEAYYGTLKAAKVSSNTVQLLAAPLAPTNLSPNGGFAVAGTTQRLDWTHNPTDGTSQKNYELQVRRAGTTTWTTYSSTTLEYRNITVSSFASDGQAIEWRVRTKGDHADWSPYSPVVSFGVASRPTVTVNAPTAGQVVEGATLGVQFVVSRAPASWTVELRNAAGQVVQTRSDYTVTASVSTTLSGLRNGETYSVRVWATDKVDSTIVTRSISVSYAQPDAPALEGAWDSTAGAVQITVTPPTGGTPTPSSIIVTRSDGTVIGTVPATGTTILTDDHAPIHEPAAYTAVARAVILGQTVDSAPATLDMGQIPAAADFLNWDGNVVRVRYSPGLSRSPQATDLQLIDLDDGTADPVAIFGPKERHTTSLTGLLVDEPGLPARIQAESFRALAAHKGLVLLRSIDGPPVWGVVTGVGLPRELWGGYQVSLTHTKAR